MPSVSSPATNPPALEMVERPNSSQALAPTTNTHSEEPTAVETKTQEVALTIVPTKEAPPPAPVQQKKTYTPSVISQDTIPQDRCLIVTRVCMGTLCAALVAVTTFIVYSFVAGKAYK